MQTDTHSENMVDEAMRGTHAALARQMRDTADGIESSIADGPGSVELLEL